MLLTQTLLHAVLDITLQAGEHLKKFYTQDINIQIKSDNTPVTNADLFLHQFLIEHLKLLTPDIPILSEECCNIPLAERSKWESYWLIDPLDGTQQFINHTGQFSIIIALVQQNKPMLGVIHSPILNHTYYAMKNYGAYKQTNKTLVKLTSREVLDSKPIVVTVGSVNARNKLQSLLNPRLDYEFKICGSSGLKSTLVASGEADCYIRLGETGEWDTGAAEILLSEVGGFITDLKFTPLTYNQRETLINPDFIMVANSQFDWKKIFNIKS